MRTKTYLFAFGDELGSEEEIEQRVLDDIESIETWRSDLPNAYYLKSALDAAHLSDEIKQRVPAEARFIIVEITDNSDGFVTPATWPFILERSDAVSSTPARSAA